MEKYPISFLLLSISPHEKQFGLQVEGTILRCSYSLSFFGDPHSCLKVRGGGLQDFSVRPLELIGTLLGLGLGGLGTRLATKG